MLILTRKLGESVKIGDDITIILLDSKGRQVKIGIEAPHHIAIYREEVFNLIKEQNIQAVKLAGIEKEALPNIWDELKRVGIKR
jgi:carbon storage regulator